MLHQDIELEYLRQPAVAKNDEYPAPPIPEEGLSSSPDGDQQEFSLPPVDGGKHAWLFLAACFAIEALVWGTSGKI